MTKEPLDLVEDLKLNNSNYEGIIDLIKTDEKYFNISEFHKLTSDNSILNKPNLGIFLSDLTNNFSNREDKNGERIINFVARNPKLSSVLNTLLDKKP